LLTTKIPVLKTTLQREFSSLTYGSLYTSVLLPWVSDNDEEFLGLKKNSDLSSFFVAII
jgi:hypothetical protein